MENSKGDEKLLELMSNEIMKKLVVNELNAIIKRIPPKYSKISFYLIDVMHEIYKMKLTEIR